MRIYLGLTLIFCLWFACPSFILAEDFDASGSDTSTTISGSLPECSRRDELACEEECRELFDDEFRQCRSECMQKRCAKKPEIEIPVGEDRELGGLCIEGETLACNGECAGESASMRARCLRSCFEKRCPGAARYDAAKEGVEPGSAACGRCRSEHKSSCRRNCRMGTSGVKITGNPGLDRVGCENLCLMTACSAECGAKIPY